MNSNDFPSCIYFDTNILRDLGLGASNTSFLELKKWSDELKRPIVIPEVVYLEWANDHREKVLKKTAQTKSNLIELEALLGRKQKKFEIPENHLEMLASSLSKKLKELGISVADTPQTISINQLVNMAVFKIRPFEEKGEKGFRDTIILHTIIEDMKQRKIKRGLFITNDQIFRHEDVQKMMKKNRVSLAFVNSFDEATQHMKDVMDEKIKLFMERKNQELLDLVKSKSDEIFSFVKENAEISEDFIIKGGLLSTKQDIFGEIQSVVAFDPISIGGAFKELAGVRDKSTYPKDMEPVIISVNTKLKVVYSPYLYFNRPKVKVQDLSRFREVARSTPVQYYGDPIEKELDRRVSVSALVKKDSQGKYIDVKLERVNTF